MATDVILVTYFVRHAVLSGRGKVLIDYATEKDCVERRVTLDVDSLSGGVDVSLDSVADNVESALKDLANGAKPCCRR